MSRVTVELEHGLRIGDTIHKSVELDAPSAADFIDASTEAERLFPLPGGGYALVQSPTLASIGLLKRQIVSVGSLGEMAVTDEMIRSLASDDLQLLQEQAAALGGAVMEEVQERGRDNPGQTGG